MKMKYWFVIVILGLSGFSVASFATKPSCNTKIFPTYQLEYCLSKTHPSTLVFINPMGNDMSVWPTAFLKPIEQFSSVLIYNRVGYGNSKVTSGELNDQVTAKEIAEQLHGLLVALKIQQPIILVAHSIGGIYALYYTKHYASDVSGLVLIDSDSPNEPLQNNPFQSSSPPTPGSIDEKELAGFNASMIAFNQEKPFPNIPLLIITATNHGSNAATEKYWQTLQKQLTTLSPQSQQIIADKSGHFIYLDQPKLVIDALRAFVKKFNTPLNAH